MSAKQIVILTCALGVGPMMAEVPQGQAAPPPVPPITIQLKDGKVETATGLRRDGNNLMAKITLPGAPGAGAPVAGEIGYPISNIANVEFPEPAQIKKAAALLSGGNATEALKMVEPAVSGAAPFRDVPGNWWAQAALVKLNALVALDRDAPAEALGDELRNSSADPELIFAARACLAAGQVRKGQRGNVQPVLDEIIQKSRSPEALAVAWLAKGQCLLEENNADGALLAFLHVPVFYYDQKQQLAAAILGSARAYQKIDDHDRAIGALEELIAHYPNCPEAGDAKRMLAKLQKNNPTK